MPTFLAFCGSARKDSFNQKTLDCVVNALHANGETITSISLNDFQAPIYDGDEETASGLPEATVRMKTLLIEHDAWIIGCPEYNGFMTPLLMNTIDWATRSACQEILRISIPTGMLAISSFIRRSSA